MKIIKVIHKLFGKVKKYKTKEIDWTTYQGISIRQADINRSEQATDY